MTRQERIRQYRDMTQPLIAYKIDNVWYLPNNWNTCTKLYLALVHKHDTQALLQDCKTFKTKKAVNEHVEENNILFSGFATKFEDVRL